MPRNDTPEESTPEVVPEVAPEAAEVTEAKTAEAFLVEDAERRANATDVDWDAYPLN